MMEIFRILDELEMMIKNSKRVPLSNGKAIIDANIFLDRLDRIRAILPEELETARLLLSEKERIVKQACEEADEYVEQSRGRAQQLIEDNEITRSALEKAEEIVTDAEQVAAEIRRDADEYADGVLSHMEIIFRRGLETISQGKEQIRQSFEKEDY